MLSVQIVRFVDDAQPGVVACEFSDAAGRRHTLVDKGPIFSTEFLDRSSKYPTEGFARCEVVSRWSDQQNRELLRITLERPDGIESTEGLSEFVVFSRQVHPWAGSVR
jgi:hypothetical protein